MQRHSLPSPHHPHHRLRRWSLRTAAPLATSLAVVALALTAVSPVVSTARAATAVSATKDGGGTLSNGCRFSPRGLPSCGAYFGAAHGANTDPAALEDRSGQRLGVRRTYFRADQVAGAVGIARADLAAGRLPWISFKLPYSWEDMAAGRGDTWARDLARRLSRLDGPVWVAFHHEPEGDGNVQAWRRMQEHLAPLVRRIAHNVAYTVIVTGWNQFFGDPAYSLARIWPRGVKIDTIGIDIYHEYGVVKNGSTIDEPPHVVRNYFRPLSAWAKRHDVAWGVAETGITDEGAQKYPSWIEGAYRRLVKNDGVAFAYFDTYLNAYGSWELATTSKQRDFARALQSSALLPD